MVALLVVIVLIPATSSLVANRTGWYVLLAGAAIVPVSVSVGGTVAGVAASSETRFCLQCHEMQAYGKSLFVDDPDSVVAAHYQNRRVPRDTACYQCHQNYAMFGTVKTKLNGVKHVWVHYLGDIPEDIELYEPYPNSNCLHCHDDGRQYLAVDAHQENAAELESGSTSCLDCHDVAHDLEKVDAKEFWQAH